MRGIILAGGNGTRLMPLTSTVNKSMLPVYDRPLIHYPLTTLIKSGVKEITIVMRDIMLGEAHHFNSYFRNVESYGVPISYRFQKHATGIAGALAACEPSNDSDNIAVMLGDTMYEDSFEEEFREFENRGSYSAGRLFVKKFPDPSWCGVIKYTPEGTIERIIEKPGKDAPSDDVVTGLYLYKSESAFKEIANLKASPRGELEITDLNNALIDHYSVSVHHVKGWWHDAGTNFEAYYQAQEIARRMRYKPENKDA